jgi:hypothetical protein
MSNDLRKMWKELPWCVLSYSPVILLEGGMGKTMKDFMVVTVQTIFQTGTFKSI